MLRLRPEESPALTPPPGNPRFPLMDACRGLAALAIVVGHSYTGALGTRLYDLAAHLGVAVQLFFALSGFLLFRPYVAALAGAGSWPRLRDFAQRRALRIIPAYWFALTFMALVRPQYVRGAFSSHAALLYGFAQVYSPAHAGEGLAVAWSLSVEVSFYVFLPAFAFLVGKYARRVGWRAGVAGSLLAVFAIGPIERLLNAVHNPAVLDVVHRLNFGLPGELPYFVTGMAMAAASVHFEVTGRLPRAIDWLVRRPTLTWVLAALLYVFVAAEAGHAPPVHVPFNFMFTYLLDVVFVGLVLLPAAFPPQRVHLPERILAWAPLGFVGLVSYGLYLWHVPLGQWMAVETPVRRTIGIGLAGWPLLCAAMVSAGLLAGTASYYLVELPFLRLKRGWRGPQGSPATAAAHGEVTATGRV